MRGEPLDPQAQGWPLQQLPAILELRTIAPRSC
jgi:hypothetical protein